MKPLAFVAAMAMALGTAAPVFGASADRQPLDDLMFIDSTTCGFEVDVSTVANNEFATTFYDNAGDPKMTIINGRFVVQVESPDSGVTLMLQVSGPIQIDWRGFSSEGGQFGISPDQFFYAHGRYDGTATVGQLTPLCPVLAGG